MTDQVMKIEARFDAGLLDELRRDNARLRERLQHLSRSAGIIEAKHHAGNPIDAELWAELYEDINKAKIQAHRVIEVVEKAERGQS